MHLSRFHAYAGHIAHGAQRALRAGIQHQRAGNGEFFLCAQTQRLFRIHLRCPTRCVKLRNVAQQSIRPHRQRHGIARAILYSHVLQRSARAYLCFHTKEQRRRVVQHTLPEKQQIRQILRRSSGFHSLRRHLPQRQQHAALLFFKLPAARGQPAVQVHGRKRRHDPCGQHARPFRLRSSELFLHIRDRRFRRPGRCEQHCSQQNKCDQPSAASQQPFLFVLHRRTSPLLWEV